MITKVLIKHHFRNIQCVEIAFTVDLLLTAVVQAKPNSHIYVFTDATPKDPEQQQYILSIVSEKHLHIDFVITGSCDSSNAHFVQRRSVHAQMVQST